MWLPENPDLWAQSAPRLPTAPIPALRWGAVQRARGRPQGAPSPGSGCQPLERRSWREPREDPPQEIYRVLTLLWPGPAYKTQAGAQLCFSCPAWDHMLAPRLPLGVRKAHIFSSSDGTSGSRQVQKANKSPARSRCVYPSGGLSSSGPWSTWKPGRQGRGGAGPRPTPAGSALGPRWAVRLRAARSRFLSLWWPAAPEWGGDAGLQPGGFNIHLTSSRQLLWEERKLQRKFRATPGWRGFPHRRQRVDIRARPSAPGRKHVERGVGRGSSRVNRPLSRVQLLPESRIVAIRWNLMDLDSNSTSATFIVWTLVNLLIFFIFFLCKWEHKHLSHSWCGN